MSPLKLSLDVKAQTRLKQPEADVQFCPSRTRHQKLSNAMLSKNAVARAIFPLLIAAGASRASF
jgi:hypothetical protein